MNTLDLKPLIHNIIALEEHELDFDHLRQLKNEFSQTNQLSGVPSNADLFKVYFTMLNNREIPACPAFEKLLKKRAVRSQSGIVPIQVLTKPFWCPGKCIFCPNDFTMPKSYINTEPGAQRALLNGFDPIKQTYNRLLSLRLNGHDTDKIEMIVLGGTRDVYPKQYKIDFIKGLYDACNTFEAFWQLYQDGKIEAQTRSLEIDTLPFVFPDTIAESIVINETAGNRMIGLTVETRPEYVTHENCRLWREMGITRIEMGIQSMFDDVLDANKRGHSIEQVRLAMHILRSYAFKISCHFMPGLYGSTPELDIETFRLAFDDIWVRPDEIKFYPTSVIPNTELYDLYKSGEYIPLETSQIKDITKIVQINHIPPYTRIKRLIRDIPATEVVAGSHVTNLRQLVDKEMELEFGEPSFVKKVAAELTDDSNQEPGKEVARYEPEDYKKQGLITDGYTIPYNPDLKDRARVMRNEMTKPEKELRFDYLRKLDINILRQKPLDHYIVDFYIPSIGLVIEVDGETHDSDEVQAYDEQRTKILEGYGLKVLRFRNSQVIDHFEEVTKQIELEISQASFSKGGGSGADGGFELSEGKEVARHETEDSESPASLRSAPSLPKRASNEGKRQKLYSRLYENMVMCDSVSDFINKL